MPVLVSAYMVSANVIEGFVCWVNVKEGWRVYKTGKGLAVAKTEVSA